jgi:hypothetical protein
MKNAHRWICDGAAAAAATSAAEAAKRISAEFWGRGAAAAA